MADENPSDLLTAAEVGEWLRCSPDTVLRYARTWGLPHRRIGRRTLFARGDVRSCLDGKRMVIEAPAAQPVKQCGPAARTASWASSGLLPKDHVPMTRFARERAAMEKAAREGEKPK